MKHGKETEATKLYLKDESRLTPLLTVSGGFATVQPGSQLSINAVEGYKLEDFSSEVRYLCNLLLVSMRD